MSNAVILKLNELGYTTIPESFYSKVAEWKSWYQGNVKGFHNYRVRNGESMVNCKRYSLGMGKKLCEDWANLLMNEKVQITLEGNKEQEFIDRILTENNFAVKANEMQEMKSALGTVAYIPRVVGQEVNESGEIVPGNTSGIVLDYVTIENIYPLAWQNGYISECAFSSVITRGGRDYLYLQIHRKEDGGEYVIENRIYRYDNEQLADEALTNVKGFERIPPVVHTGSDKRQFVIDRLNIANNFNYLLPTGISVYANAIDALEGADIAYDAYINEFVMGKKRIMVKPAASKFLDGTPAFDENDLVYYVMPEDVSDGAVIQPIDMTLNSDKLSVGVQFALNILGSKCGFGTNFYQIDQAVMATATQVISTHSELAKTRGKHQIILEQVLVELCRVLLRLGNTTMNAGLDENIEISIDFDDSIFQDKDAEFARDMQLLSAGILNDYEMRMTYKNEDEATAKAALPKMQDMTTEGQQEVE